MIKTTLGFFASCLRVSVLSFIFFDLSNWWVIFLDSGKQSSSNKFNKLVSRKAETQLAPSCVMEVYKEGKKNGCNGNN